MPWIDTLYGITRHILYTSIRENLRNLLHQRFKQSYSPPEDRLIELAIGKSTIESARARFGPLQNGRCRCDSGGAGVSGTVGEHQNQRSSLFKPMVDTKFMTGMGDN